MKERTTYCLGHSEALRQAIPGRRAPSGFDRQRRTVQATFCTIYSPLLHVILDCERPVRRQIPRQVGVVEVLLGRPPLPQTRSAISLTRSIEVCAEPPAREQGPGHSCSWAATRSISTAWQSAWTVPLPNVCTCSRSITSKNRCP